MLDKFADELREKRLQEGISLEQMASKTKIDIKFLEALDEGNFAFLPELYVKAFIKQYARVISLDETQTLKRYDAAREGKLFQQDIRDTVDEKEQTSVPDKAIKPASSQKPQQSQPKFKSYNDPSVERRNIEMDSSGKEKFMIAAAAVGIIVILVAVYLYFIRDTKDIIVAEKPIEEVIEQTRQRYVEEENQNPNQVTVPDSDSLHLKFVSSESSWIFVVIDDQKTEEFTLSPGISKVVSGINNIKATVGNSGSVQLILNNNPIEFSGRSGAVRHFSLNKEGLQYLNTPPKLNR